MGAKEVATGAAWLDENFPGWEREIDLGELDIENCSLCICGQSLRKFVVNGLTGYDIALAVSHGLAESKFRNRALRFNWANEHGFYARNFMHATTLESLWRDLIKERFSTGNLSDNVE